MHRLNVLFMLADLVADHIANTENFINKFFGPTCAFCFRQNLSVNRMKYV